MTTKDEILRLFKELTREEQDELIYLLKEELDNSHAKTISAKFIIGNKIQKTSSKECSSAQRMVFLGTSGSKLKNLQTSLVDAPVIINQGCRTKDGAFIFTSSEYIKTPATDCEEGCDVLRVAEAIKEQLNAAQHKVPTSYISKLSKCLDMRTKDKFSRLPVAENGQLTAEDPYYPNNELTRYYLPAVPWQRYLYTLKPSWYTLTGLVDLNEHKYLLLKENFCIALLPLTNDNDEKN